jgi:hypothetical protein
MAKKTINVQGTSISIVVERQEEYISLTDMTLNFGGSSAIERWLRNKDTIEFLGVWETMNNATNFKSPEFEGIRNEAGTNRFGLSVKEWVEKTNAKGILAKAGRYGGTYAHKDIALEFGSWLNPVFKYLVVREFQRLKEDEAASKSLEWNLQRTLAKINYRIHTNAIRDTLIPRQLSRKDMGLVYASEADLLNIALFGQTARAWQEANPDKKGNVRDFATLEQLVVLSNLESINSVFIQQGLNQADRLIKLNEIAISQMKALITDTGKKSLVSGL